MRALQRSNPICKFVRIVTSNENDLGEITGMVNAVIYKAQWANDGKSVQAPRTRGMCGGEGGER